MKGGRDSARLAHRTRYFATREGVQLLKDDNAHLPTTKKQQQYIRRLLRSFPEARELPEHEDYANTPNRQTAFVFPARCPNQIRAVSSMIVCIHKSTSTVPNIMTVYVRYLFCMRYRGTNT